MGYAFQLLVYLILTSPTATLRLMTWSFFTYALIWLLSRRIIVKSSFPYLNTRITFLQALPHELLDEISRFPYLEIRNRGFPWLADRKPSEAEVGETLHTTKICSLPLDLRYEIQAFCLLSLRRTRKVDPEARNFFSLPLELRDKVYSNLLISPHRLRPPREFRRRQTRRHNQDGNRRNQGYAHILQSTALLATCSSINNEAVPFFYKYNRFHYSIPLHRLPYPRQQTPHLEHMHHLSIDFAHTWPSSFTSFNRHTPGRVDSTIANHIRRICVKCPSLRSFTLHILADPGFMPVVERYTALWGVSEMETHFMRWPEVSMADWQLQEVWAAGAHYGRRDLIREWHCWSQGTEKVRKEYWEGKRLGFVGGFQRI